jgi:quercetin dioxygenase-like cupin family protein
VRTVQLEEADISEHGSAGVHMVEVVRIGNGDDFRVHTAVFQPSGVIGRHSGRLWQLFFIVSGAGWVSGADSKPSPVSSGETVVWEPNEEHEAGSEGGMEALIVQSSRPLPRGVLGT